MVEEISIAIIGLIITGIGLVIAILFNTLAIRSTSKIRHYEIMRNFEEKFHEIQNIDLHKDPLAYPMTLVNWCTFMEQMNKEKIIPIKFLSDYGNVFGEARWILVNLANFKKEHETSKKQYVDWCKKHGFEEIPTSPQKLDLIQSATKVKTLKISEIPSSKAQLFWCAKCKKFFRTAEDLKKHNDEKHGNENKSKTT